VDIVATFDGKSVLGRAVAIARLPAEAVRLTLPS